MQIILKEYLQMLIRLQLILSVIALPLMLYSFITKDYTLQPYATLLFGLIMLIIGLVQFQNKSKGFSTCMVITCLDKRWMTCSYTI